MYTPIMNSVIKIEKSKNPSPDEHKKRVAAYARVSTSSDEQLESLSAQKTHYESLIKANSEWEYAGLYYDEGISGTEMTHRKGLLALITDCERGLIDHVLIKSISRMARNTVDSLAVVRKLKDLGISIYFEKENINTAEMDGELLLSIMSSIAEDESHSISENCKWSCQRRFRNGTYSFGYVPYGYKVENGRIVVNPAEAETVKLIFKSYLNGLGSMQIAKMLNEKGIKPRRTGQWCGNTIHSILVNEKYTGDCLFQKTYTDERFNRHANKGEREQYYMRDHHEALVSREDFEKVRALLEKHSMVSNTTYNGQTYKNRYAFSGKVTCAQCGSAFKHSIVYNGKTSYPILVCRGHVEDSRKCTAKSIKEEQLKSAFTTMLNKLIFVRDILVKPFVESLNKSSFSYNGESHESIKEKLDDNLRRRQILSNLYAENLIEQSVYLTENNALLSEAAELSLKMKRCTALQDGKYTNHAAALELLKIVNSCQLQTEFSAELFEKIVGRITVLSRTEVEFSLRCGLNLKEEI